MAADSVKGAAETRSTLPLEPPPEKASTVWNRRTLIAAFWAVVICLGLPHWTWTTSIPRAALPLDSMNAWAEGKACQLHYPLYIALKAPDLPPDSTAALATRLEALLNRQRDLRWHRFHILSDSPDDASPVALTVNLDTKKTAAAPHAALRSWQPVLDAEYAMTPSTDPKRAAVFLASELSRLFEDETASLWHLIKDTPYATAVPPLQLSPEKTAELDKRTTRAFKYASTYHLTFSLFTPAATPSSWDIEQALQAYIGPLLSQLSPISDFTINTQVQLFASFSPSIAGPVFDAAKGHWTLQYSDLTGFVNAAEWPLNPSIGSGPTINFVLYVPSSHQTPLLIDGNGGTSWIIPQWGGVQIHNYPSNSTDYLESEHLRADILIFSDQLAALIGLPQSPSSLSLRISSLTRERATSLILSASSTLGALSRLAQKLTSIAIPDTVAQSVDETLRRLDAACLDLKEGRFQSALENARIAETEAELAFFEPSMVGQVYFPEEHKVAVYVPLLGPMAVPLVMSAIKEIRNFRERKRNTT